MKRILALLLAIVMAFSLAACGNKFDIIEYKTLVSDCVEQINDGAIALSNIVKYEYNYWENITQIGGTFKTEDAVQAAVEWLEKNSDYRLVKIKEQYSNVAEMYKEITSIETKGSEADEIKETFKELYDAYIGLYNLAFAPSGGSTFATSYNNCAETIRSSAEKLNILLAE